uniref:Alpha galactosidase A C-terminal domain-containing protein n=1 Tax=Lutzomyia longipalpis TaxID=7200 RepID=A0A1B0GJD5_LUTLO
MIAQSFFEKLFKRTADRLVEDGYLALGYEYVIVDDCWMEMERDEEGRLVADRERFPNGIKALADYVDNQDRIQHVAGPGHWNDPDMLIIGNYGLSVDQSKAQMAIWAILAAPLLMSNDLDRIRPEFREILQNRDIIAVNQDPLGLQGRRIRYTNKIEVWVRPVLPTWGINYSYAVAFVSHRTDGAPYTLSLDIKSLGLKSTMRYAVYDLFEKSTRFIVGRSSKSPKLQIRVNPSGVVFYKFEALDPNARFR